MNTGQAPVLFSVDLRGCGALEGLGSEKVISAFATALTRAGANVVVASSYVFPGEGLTSVLILRESHAVIHTWPETGTVNIDIFSCTARLRCMEAVNELRGVLGAAELAVQTLPRADGHGPRVRASSA